MKKVLLVAAACAFLGACATQIADPWISKSEDEVIAKLGFPCKTYESYEKKYMVYNGSKDDAVRPTYAFGSLVNGNNCTTIFILDDGKVESWKTTGQCY